jgi:hypothetical protein
MNTPAAASPASEPAALVRIKDEDQTLEFAGDLVASSTTRQGDKPRWLDLKLYRITDGTGRYVIWRTGSSLVRHRAGGPCNRGVSVSVHDLPPDSVPCQSCAAPSIDILRAMPNARASQEVPHHKAIVCQDARDVLRRLRLRGDAEDGDEDSSSSAYSAPAQRLLDEAELNDAGIRQARNVIRQL